MNKKVILSFVLGAVIAVVGIGIFQSSATSPSPELSAEEVSGLLEAQYSGTVTDIAFSDSNGTYQAELESKGMQYAVNVNGDNGEILDLQETGTAPTASGEQSEQGEAPAEEPSGDQKKTDGQANGKDPSEDPENTENQSGDNQQTSNDGTLSKEEAKAIAQEEFSGTIAEMELDKDDGRMKYEIEIINGEDESQIEIDAYTGEVIVVEIDREEEED